jgi:ABC-type polysaccharide transport system permease subunit
MADKSYECNDTVKKYFPIGCSDSTSWGIIGLFSFVGLTMFAVQFKRHKKDKMIMINMIYFTILLFLSIIGVIVLSKYNGKDNTRIQNTSILFKAMASLVLFGMLLLQSYETVDDFTNTILSRKEDENKNKKKMN